MASLNNSLPGTRVVLAFAFTAALVISTIACAPNRPIAPIRASNAYATEPSVFDADQLERLERLRAALTEPVASDLASGLVVRLAFDEAADLDLFVTDPLQEAVYFANSPTRTGGSLIDDRRCDDPSPRIETVHYPNPIAGRYRVGVDFHRQCEGTQLSGDAATQGLYVVQVDVGERVLERSGMATPGHFEVIVIEFEVEQQ